MANQDDQSTEAARRVRDVRLHGNEPLASRATGVSGPTGGSPIRVLLDDVKYTARRLQPGVRRMLGIVLEEASIAWQVVENGIARLRDSLPLPDFIGRRHPASFSPD